MKTKNKGPITETETVETPSSISPRRITPPGRVRPPGHGLQTGRLDVKTGSARLAEIMQLSGEVPIEKLCGDAAAEIEKLRGELPAWPWPET